MNTVNWSCSTYLDGCDEIATYVLVKSIVLLCKKRRKKVKANVEISTELKDV